MLPRYYHCEPTEVTRLLDAEGIDYLETGVITKAIHACSRGYVSIVVDPEKLELVLAINGKVSPSLSTLAAQCGGADIAIRLLEKLGAAVSVYALRFAMSQ
jgi:hypothetical protein